MKKLCTVVLTLILLFSFSATAFAAYITEDTEPKTGSMKVTYQVAPGYTVTIPENVTLGSDPVMVKAENVKIDKGSQVVVKLTATSEDDDTFKIKTSEGAELDYTIKNGETIINVGDTVLAVNSDSTTAETLANGSAELTFALVDGETIQYSGTYKGTVTFTVSVEEV